MAEGDETPERRRLRLWSEDNPRDRVALVAVAAWLNVTPDQLPPQLRLHTCEATKVAWARVAEAVREESAERERDFALKVSKLEARAEAAEAALEREKADHRAAIARHGGKVRALNAKLKEANSHLEATINPNQGDYHG